jgi:hypothetical protein
MCTSSRVNHLFNNCASIILHFQGHQKTKWLYLLPCNFLTQCCFQEFHSIDEVYKIEPLSQHMLFDN